MPSRPPSTSPPLVHITVGKELADDMVRAATDPDGDNITLLADRDDIDRWCELADGTPLHPHLAMAVLAVAEFNRLVLDAESEDPGLGRSSIRLCRSNGLGLRQSAARSRSEATDPSPRQVRGQADHVHAWAKHGPTATHNSQPLCRPDNRHKGDN